MQSKSCYPIAFFNPTLHGVNVRFFTQWISRQCHSDMHLMMLHAWYSLMPRGMGFFLSPTTNPFCLTEGPICPRRKGGGTEFKTPVHHVKQKRWSSPIHAIDPRSRGHECFGNRWTLKLFFLLQLTRKWIYIFRCQFFTNKKSWTGGWVWGLMSFRFLTANRNA